MDFKNVKKELEKVYEDISHQIDNNKMPELKPLQEFTRLARLMPMLADDEWIGEAEDFSHLATQLLQAARHEDFGTVVQLMDSLNDAMQFCHKTFR
ncbi:GAK system XXXCH domain-containing protein [Desulfonatronovibrio magnus]|uniref:GAK system XXXCH domain-containing protein n=1 Tax=Desulfonatronovibrio magnus TaxID=698827 RepID=UPI0005EB7C6F|nr:GAK system XXXCH domain-containing protein [Desulfonatronovibrio magnus]